MQRLVVSQLATPENSGCGSRDCLQDLSHRFTEDGTYRGHGRPMNNVSRPAASPTSSRRPLPRWARQRA